MVVSRSLCGRVRPYFSHFGVSNLVTCWPGPDDQGPGPLSCDPRPMMKNIIPEFNFFYYFVCFGRVEIVCRCGRRPVFVLTSNGITPRGKLGSVILWEFTRSLTRMYQRVLCATDPTLISFPYKHGWT